MKLDNRLLFLFSFLLCLAPWLAVAQSPNAIIPAEEAAIAADTPPPLPAGFKNQDEAIQAALGGKITELIVLG